MKITTVVFGTLILFIAVTLSYSAEKADIYSHETGIWEIAGPLGQKRWIVIHNLAEAKETGLFHIEIIGRNKGQPVWSVKHLCSHMAITGDALRRSTVRPIESGAVYPESFDSAFAEWQRKAARGYAPICTTSITECLESK